MLFSFNIIYWNSISYFFLIVIGCIIFMIVFYLNQNYYVSESMWNERVS